jgi:hypothetical protein
MILVFCTPTFPAIVRENSFLKKVASSFLSWIPTFSARSSSRWSNFEFKQLGNADERPAPDSSKVLGPPSRQEG